MRVAALYDIHGNLPALEAVLEDVWLARVDRIVIGGDIFPGPMACDVFRIIRDLDIPVDYVRGNGDRAVVDIAAGRESRGLPPALAPLMEWHVAQLSRAELDAMAQWPTTMALAIGQLGDVLFCHATPRDDNEMFNVATAADRIAPAFDGVSERVVICGHTHRPFDRMIGDVRVVNAGSVGMPLGDRGAHWLLLGESIEPRRTSYDLSEAAGRVRGTDYPRKDEFIQIAL